MSSHLISARVVAVVLVFMSGACAARASEPPVRVAGFDIGYDELLSHGANVWAARYDPSRWDRVPASTALRQLVVDGVVSPEVERPLPESCVRVAVSPQGTFYAVARGAAPLGADLASSVHLLRRDSFGLWQEVRMLRDVSSRPELSGAALEFGGTKLVVRLTTYYGDGWSPSPFVEEQSVVVDLESGQLVPTESGFLNVAGDGAGFVGTRIRTLDTGEEILEPVRSTNGETWNARPATVGFNHLATPLLDPARPEVARNGICFWFYSHLGAVGVGGASGETVAYPVAGVERLDPRWAQYAPPSTPRFRQMAVARDGESWAGVWEENEALFFPHRGILKISHDYLLDFETYEWSDLGHIGIVAAGDAFYLMRAEADGAGLYRLGLPSERLQLANDSPLSIEVGTGSFFNGLTLEQEGRQTLGIRAPAVPGAFRQIWTSTDLETWRSAGLPAPTGPVESFIVRPEVPRRFFR